MTRSARHPDPVSAGVAVLVVAMVAAACIGGESPGPGSADPSTPATTSAPSESAEPTGPDGPTDSAGPTGIPSSSVEPSETAAGTPSPGTTGVPGTPASACSGSDDNRIFFDQAALAMSWPVYCAVLPDGWFLDAGSYRLADGGHLEVTYRGPSGAHLALVEGAICEDQDVDTCAPRDAVIGPATFGDREGELGRLGNGLVLDVDRGATPAWRATGLGLTEDAFRALCAALFRIEG